jgi:hypothetical protein
MDIYSMILCIKYKEVDFYGQWSDLLEFPGSWVEVHCGAFFPEVGTEWLGKNLSDGPRA